MGFFLFCSGMGSGKIKSMKIGELKPRKSAVIFTGLQASGKSAFYKEYLASTHVRINLDELHTRNKEKLLLEEYISEGRSFAVDNTNPAAADRARYIVSAKQAGYSITGVYFVSSLKECIERNDKRDGKARIPAVAIAATAAKLKIPDKAEGFDELYYVRIEDGRFIVEEHIKESWRA
jgi:predicted kinase